jgi:hypothetical protein
VRRLPELLFVRNGDRARLWTVLYFILVAAVFSLALVRRFALPLVPILDADSPNFLWPALLKLNGEGFIHNAGLNFIYPGTLYLLLRAFSDFRAIVIFQHVLGVAAGAFFLLGWNRLHDFDAASPIRRGVHRAIGLIGVAVYLFSATPILFETQIRADALCMFAQMLSVWLVLQFLFYRCATPNSRRAVSYGIGGVASALLLYSLKPSYALTALLTIGLVVWLMIRARSGWKDRTLFFAGALVAVVLFVVPEWLLARGDRLSRMFLPQTLFVVHAKIIHAQMGDDLEHNVATPFPRAWLEKAHDELGAEVARTHERFPAEFSTLGFHPDYLMNGDDAIITRWLHQLGGDDALQQFLEFYYWRALRHRPLSFAAKISEQLAIFYNWKCPAFLTYPRIILGPWHYAPSLAVQKDPENWEQMGKLPAGIQLAAQTEVLAGQTRELRSGKGLVFCHALLARAYLPALLVSAGLASWVLLVQKPFGSGRRIPSLIVFFLFLLNFGNVLAISVVHSMQVDRYSTVQFAAALFAELWALRYLLAFVMAGFEDRRAAPRPG